MIEHREGIGGENAHTLQVGWETPVWYDIRTRWHLKSEDALPLRQNPRTQPPTQRTSYDFEPNAAIMEYTSEGNDTDVSEETYEMQTKGPPPEDDIACAPEDVNVGCQQPQQNPVDDETEFGLLKRFVKEDMVPPTSIQGDLQYLQGLPCAHLCQGATESSA